MTNPLIPHDNVAQTSYVSEVAANIARRAALVAHCRHDWRECVRVLVEAKEIEGWSGRGA